MMSFRELVVRAVECADPEWTPYHVSIPAAHARAHSPAWEAAGLEDALLAMGATRDGDSIVAQPIIAWLGPVPNTPPAPHRPLAEDEWVDEWGTIWTCPDYPRVSGHPLEVDWQLLDEYRPPDPHAGGRYEQARSYMLAHPDRYRLGSVWFTLFERLWMLRGFSNALTDPYLYPDSFARLCDMITEFNLASISRQLSLGVDGIYFSDDWGTQRSLLISRQDWCRWYKPCYKRLFERVHRGGAHVWMHLCGNVTAIIPDLIEIGLDVLNPVQPQAMDVDALAAAFHGQLCFFGGVDVQDTLPRGTRDDVDAEVRRLISIFGEPSGGYIGATSHSILGDTPPENVMALFAAFREHSGYASACNS